MGPVGLFVAAALALVVLVAACGSSSNNNNTPSGGGGSNTTANSGSSSGSNFKVGLVTDIGGLNDHGFNHLAYVGLLRAEKELGIQGRVLTSSSGADYL